MPSAVPAGAAALVVADTLRAYLALARLGARARARPRRRDHRQRPARPRPRRFLRALLARAPASPRRRRRRRTRTTRSASPSSCSALETATRASRSSRWARASSATSTCSCAAARPDVGVLTNVGDAHLEIMGSRERLAETKWGLFATGARACSTSPTPSRARAPPTLARAPVWFGIDAERPPARASARVVTCSSTTSGRSSRDGDRARDVAVSPIDVPGDHNRAQSRRRRSPARWRSCGVGAAHARRARSPALALPARALRTHRAAGGIDVIFDAYNASMTRDARDARDVRARSGRRGGSPCSAAWRNSATTRRAMHERVGAARRRREPTSCWPAALSPPTSRAARADAGARPRALVRYASNADAVALAARQRARRRRRPAQRLAQSTRWRRSSRGCSERGAA